MLLLMYSASYTCICYSQRTAPVVSVTTEQTLLLLSWPVRARQPHLSQHSTLPLAYLASVVVFLWEEQAWRSKSGSEFNQTRRAQREIQDYRKLLHQKVGLVAQLISIIILYTCLTSHNNGKHKGTRFCSKNDNIWYNCVVSYTVNWIIRFKCVIGVNK